MVADFRRLHPQVGLRVDVNNWSQLLVHLQAETIEFFVSDLRALPPELDLHVQSLGRQMAGFYVRAGHPLAGRACCARQFWPQGVATTRLPAVVKAALAQVLGLPPGQLPPLALECDDVALLRTAALPPLFSEMGIVRLSQRTPSPAAQQAIALVAQAAQQVNTAAAG